jgi:hypothetical protein
MRVDVPEAMRTGEYCILQYWPCQGKSKDNRLGMPCVNAATELTQLRLDFPSWLARRKALDRCPHRYDTLFA